MKDRDEGVKESGQLSVIICAGNGGVGPNGRDNLTLNLPWWFQILHWGL